MVARVATFLDQSHDLHGQVLDAVAAGDQDAASHALRLDLGRTRDLILAANPAELGIQTDVDGQQSHAGRPSHADGRVA
jgi:hypothetical protein